MNSDGHDITYSQALELVLFPDSMTLLRANDQSQSAKLHCRSRPLALERSPPLNSNEFRHAPQTLHR
jgi:hypothetical protein